MIFSKHLPFNNISICNTRIYDLQSVGFGNDRLHSYKDHFIPNHPVHQMHIQNAILTDQSEQNDEEHHHHGRNCNDKCNKIASQCIRCCKLNIVQSGYIIFSVDTAMMQHVKEYSLKQI